VKDFHAVNKEYINTLNVCAVQELHKKITSQQSEIKELNEKVNILLNYIDMSKMTTIQNEIDDLKARYDFIIRYIDLSK
jgi:DNA-binding transcriptional regulator GbsR (MarR family)